MMIMVIAGVPLVLLLRRPRAAAQAAVAAE
jgi:hypothetical protein